MILSRQPIAEAALCTPSLTPNTPPLRMSWATYTTNLSGSALGPVFGPSHSVVCRCAVDSISNAAFTRADFVPPQDGEPASTDSAAGAVATSAVIRPAVATTTQSALVGASLICHAIMCEPPLGWLRR